MAHTGSQFGDYDEQNNSVRTSHAIGHNYQKLLMVHLNFHILNFDMSMKNCMICNHLTFQSIMYTQKKFDEINYIAN